MAEGAHRVDPSLVRPIEPGDADGVRAFVSRYWQSSVIVTRAREHDAAELPGFVLEENGQIIGVITLNDERCDCEVVTIDSAEWGRGIGSALLDRAEQWARERGCERLWLVTTNDNLRALYFYQRRGFRIVAVHRDAVMHSREIKPEIPDIADNGIPILDELELEKEIGDGDRFHI
jgi:N-acetylglutamate synthase-like GNAT family acetyltransferase